VYIVLDSMYETMSISTGLYPNLDLWNANKLHYTTLHYITLQTIPHIYILILLMEHQNLRKYIEVFLNNCCTLNLLNEMKQK